MVKYYFPFSAYNNIAMIYDNDNFFNNLSKRVRLLGLLLSGGMNLLYVVSNILSGVVYKSFWYFSLTICHMLFLSVRFYLFSKTKGKEPAIRSSLIISKRVGSFLVILDALAIALCFYSFLVDEGARQGVTMLYPLGIYTAYSIIISLYGIFISQKNKIPTYLAYRNITLTTALFSLFNLVYSALHSFGKNTLISSLLLTAIGSFVFTFSLSLALYLVQRSKSGLKRLDSFD